MQSKTITKTFVTAPSLAPLEEYAELLRNAWETGILTHHGPIVQELERRLKEVLKMDNLITVTNGTIAIQMAIRALDLKGEIITTPFTWVATINSIIWENCTPVFVDIDEETLNIDPAKIEAAINYRTSAIMGVHVFSNPCDVEAIDEIAKKHNLKVIYDGAHAMSVDYKGKSVFEYGDISTVSFHATKLFNTGEGGACFAPDDEVLERLRRLRFFGHNDKKEIVDMGLNGKMTELHAALGVANLKYADMVLVRRKEIYEGLKDISSLRFQKFDSKSYNYSYMPIIFESEELLLKVMKKLNEKDIYPRRYFYPSMNTITSLAPYSSMPISEKIAECVLCLPSFTQLENDKIDEIITIIRALA
jgi:dTDP-4-amino-4,6-dideoxygalactose transaminase